MGANVRKDLIFEKISDLCRPKLYFFRSFRSLRCNYCFTEKSLQELVLFR